MAEPPPAEPRPPARKHLRLPSAAAGGSTSGCRSGASGSAPAERSQAGGNRPRVGLQTIATAYRDYTRKSIQDAQSYVEKLSGVRSLDKAMEVQTEFAKQACETFAADSRKIRELYGEFFRQTLRLPKSPFDRTR